MTKHLFTTTPYISISLFIAEIKCETISTQRFIITLIRYFNGVGLTIWMKYLDCNMDYNYYILQDLDFKILRLRI